METKPSERPAQLKVKRQATAGKQSATSALTSPARRDSLLSLPFEETPLAIRRKIKRRKPSEDGPLAASAAGPSCSKPDAVQLGSSGSEEDQTLAAVAQQLGHRTEQSASARKQARAPTAGRPSKVLKLTPAEALVLDQKASKSLPLPRKAAAAASKGPALDVSTAALPAEDDGSMGEVEPDAAGCITALLSEEAGGAASLKAADEGRTAASALEPCPPMTPEVLQLLRGGGDGCWERAWQPESQVAAAEQHVSWRSNLFMTDSLAHSGWAGGCP